MRYRITSIRVCGHIMFKLRINKIVRKSEIVGLPFLLNPNIQFLFIKTVVGHSIRNLHQGREFAIS